MGSEKIKRAYIDKRLSKSPLYSKNSPRGHPKTENLQYPSMVGDFKKISVIRTFFKYPQKQLIFERLLLIEPFPKVYFLLKALLMKDLQERGLQKLFYRQKSFEKSAEIF